MRERTTSGDTREAGRGLSEMYCPQGVPLLWTRDGFAGAFVHSKGIPCGYPEGGSGFSKMDWPYYLPLAMAQQYNTW